MPSRGIGGIFGKFAFKEKSPEEIMRIEEEAIEEMFSENCAVAFNLDSAHRAVTPCEEGELEGGNR